MNLKHSFSWQCFCGSNILTLSWRVSVHCPITLYPEVLLILIWYWKRSYRPGASPFRLNVTDVPALPTKERIIFRNVPSTLSDENTLHQPYIKKKKKKPWHALQTSKKSCAPLRKKVCVVVTEIQTTCAPQAMSGDWQVLTLNPNRLFEEFYLQGLAFTITNLPKHNQQCVFLNLRWNIHSCPRWVSASRWGCWHILITLITLGVMGCAR